MKSFVDDDVRAAFAEAIRDLEAQSGAEVQIAVRHHSGSYFHADVITGAVAGFATLAFLMFSPWEFGPWAFLLDTLLVGFAMGYLSSRFPWLHRHTTRRSAQRRRVERDARETFYKKGMSRTRARSGLLVYISLSERMVELVPDLGLMDTAAPAFFREEADAIANEITSVRSGVAVAKALARLGPPLATMAPRGDDDINELPDEVCHT